MRKTFSIAMEMTSYDLNILIKCLEYFRYSSNFFENGEYTVGAEDLENLILKGIKGVNTRDIQLN